MGWNKLHSSLVNSSLWTEPDSIRLLFITLLALANRHGEVFGSRGGLERAANIMVEEDDPNPWQALMETDPDSSDILRNPENEGRRIEEIPGGFRIINHEYYRGLKNDDDRREQNRRAQARFRTKKVSRHKPSSATVSVDKPSPSASVSVSDSESVPKKKEEGTGEKPTVEEIYQAYPKKEAKDDALKAIQKRLKEGKDPAFLLERVKTYAKAITWLDRRFIPHPATWFNKGCFDDDEAEWHDPSKPKPKPPSKSVFF